MMARSARCYRSRYQLQDQRGTWILTMLLLLLSVVSVDAAYRGVGTRDHGLSFYCEVHVAGASPRVKIWVGTYRTEALAALACDVVFFYTKSSSMAFNLEYSEDAIFLNCKSRSVYDSLSGWEERKKFIKAEANALLNLVSSEDLAPNFRWENVVVPPLARPLVPVRQRSGDVARTIVEHFQNQAGQLREFMAWLIHFSNAATRVPGTHKGRFQQRSQESISQSDIEEALSIEGEQFLDAARVTLLLDSVESRLGGAMWLTLIASSLALLFQMFAKNNALDIEDISINANEASLTEQDRCQSIAERVTKRRKVNQPWSSIELDPGVNVAGDLFTVTHLDVTRGTPQQLLFLPPPHPGLNYSICGHESLKCVNISTVGAELVVFNPLTGNKRPLPPLLFPRHPVLLHMLVNTATKTFRVIVAGSSRLDEEHLSKKMEVFDSKTSKWEEMCDLPGPAFGLNEYQEGVCAKGILYFISFLNNHGPKSVVAFDVENKKWLPNMICPLPHSYPRNTVQLVGNNGELYRFYEQAGEPYHTHLIDMLEISNSASEEVSCHWRNVVTATCAPSFDIDTRYICKGLGEGELCIFDTTKRCSMIYDVRSGNASEVSESLQVEQSVFLNPLPPFLHSVKRCTWFYDGPKRDGV